MRRFWWTLLLMTSSLQKHFELQEHYSSDASSFLFVEALLMNFASDDIITSGALSFRRFKLPFCWGASDELCFWWHHHFRSTILQTLQASSLLILLLSFVLPEPFKNTKFCLWSYTLEQILAYPIDNFLIPCYHQNLKSDIC